MESNGCEYQFAIHVDDCNLILQAMPWKWKEGKKNGLLEVVTCLLFHLLSLRVFSLIKKII